MAIKIQYRQLWNGATWEDWTDVGEFEVEKGTSTLEVVMPPFGQSDRLVGSSSYGANALIDCVFHVNATRANNNAVTLAGDRMDTFQFIYDSSAWGSQIGAQVVKGTYDYYALDKNNTECFIYTYDGGNTVVADYTVDIPGVSIDAVRDFSVAPQQFSNEEYYGRCYNQVNGNVVQVYLRFQNTYPADYRPGKIWNGSDWMSHNRDSGATNIRNGSSGWNELRTLDGPNSSGDPPEIRGADSWQNMRLIGTE